MHKLPLPGIVVLAFLLRVIAINSYPVGFTPDEASFGYDAYSLLKTGKDQWGEPFPLTFRSFGDFKLPLYTYLTMPSIAIFGLNEFSVRLPNAIFSTLAVLVTYLLTRKLFKDPKISIVASFLLAISPWHIPLSRGAFEANLTTFFLPLGMWAFLKGITRPRWMIVAAFAFGFNLFSYHSARLVAPLILFVLIWWKYREFGSVIRYRLPIAVFVIFSLVAGYTMLTGAGSRGAEIAIFNPTGGWAGVSDRRYEVVLQGFPDTLARIFSNKVVYTFDQFISRYLTYISPKFLFAEGSAEWTYGMIPGRGVLYLIEVLFVVAAIWAAIRGRAPGLGIIFLWILLAPIPASLAKGEGFAGNRAAVMMPALQILSAYGTIILYSLLVERWSKITRLLSYGFMVVLLTSLIVFLEDYRYHAPLHSASSMLYGRREAVEYIRKIEHQYSEVVFSRSLSEPHIYIAFYSQWDAEDYQRQSPDWLRYEKEGRTFVDQLGEYHLGKYTFRSINYSKDNKLTGTLLVGKPEEFPQDIVPLKTIYYPNKKPAIFIIDPSNETIIQK